MLYKHGVDLLRMHSSFVEENEVEGLIEKLGTITQAYNQSALDFLENGGDGLEDEDELIRGGSFTSGTSSDPMYQQALEVVTENGNASASMLQRRLRVGYNRAANLVEEMERNGIVGPAQGSKPRKVLARSE
jgi:S-DNA-T family DNA segregation ATPase FtsK/SpoIIIE